MDKASAKTFLHTTLSIAVLLVLIAAFVVIKRNSNKVVYDEQGNPIISEAEDKALDAQIAQAIEQIDFGNFDTDKDGVPDWREYIYGLNPASAQTFGDDTNDKIFMDNIDGSVSTSGSVYDELTLSPTDVFAQNLFKLSQRAQSGEDVTTMGDQLVQSIMTLDLVPDLTKADIEYASDYKESYDNFVAQTAPIIAEQKIFEITEVLGAEDIEAEKVRDKIYELKNVLNNYTSILSVTPPPQAWIESYLKLFNTTRELNQKLYYIVQDTVDPVSTMNALGGLQNAVNDFMLAKREMLQLMYQYVEKSVL